ncbi:Uncharacterised protein [Bordetella pertussis]|nr:Uncharacterised protein [Bordetella pertussis]
MPGWKSVSLQVPPCQNSKYFRYKIQNRILKSKPAAKGTETRAIPAQIAKSPARGRGSPAPRKSSSCPSRSLHSCNDLVYSKKLGLKME